MVGLRAWRVVIFSTAFSAAIAYLHSRGLNLARSSPGVRLICHLLLQPSSRSTGLSSPLENSLILSIAKSEPSPAVKPFKGDAHTLISDWEEKKKPQPTPTKFSLHCSTAFWRDRSTARTALSAFASLPLCCCPGEAALLAAVLVFPLGILLL